MAIIKTKAPAFHITGKTGWINDPNGLIYFGGKYHAFFQHYPHDTKWGPMHWGHVVSDDLTNWEYLPNALCPGGEGEADGCFSGSAIVHDGKLWLLYTGFEENGGGDAVRQVQCLASSEDGVTFTKHGVVIGTSDLPDGYAPSDFRDPNVWREEGHFWCVIAARKIEGRGRILLYRSEDLFHWQFVNDLYGTDSAGSMIECPDYNEEMGCLLFCEQFQPSEEGIHLNLHTCRYAIGRIDYASGRFVEKSRGIVDYGHDFYAPQTFVGAPVMMAWLNMWDRNVPSAKYGFAGMLTVARHIDIKDGALYQTPVIACGATTRTEGSVDGCKNGRHTDRMDRGVITVGAKNLRGMDLSLRVGGGCRTTISLVGDEWILDRSHSGEQIVGVETDADSLAGIRRMPHTAGDETTLTVVMDDFSLEVFEGGRSLTSTIYPPDGANGIELSLTADEWYVEKADVVLSK